MLLYAALDLLVREDAATALVRSRERSIMNGSVRCWRHLRLNRCRPPACARCLERSAAAKDVDLSTFVGVCSYD